MKITNISHFTNLPIIKTQMLAFFMMILIGGSIFLMNSLVTPPRDNPKCMQASIPIYELPTGSHYNSKLDTLNASDLTLLRNLEKALWTFTKLRQPCGGFPMFTTTDFCTFVGDGGKLWPNEICLQYGTPRVGELYLMMYLLEPNPIYLNIAKGAGDALVSAQLEDGGFYKYARMDEYNQSIDPHNRNPRHHSSYDDDTMQGVVRYLLKLYNITREIKYLDSINKAFDHLIRNQYEWGAWPQETNYIYPYYQIYSTLNDGLMEDMIDTFLLGIQILPDRKVEFKAIIDKAFEWLVSVQGNGGKGLQIGAWAQQYDFNHQPCWARAFEPPAMESSGTAGLIKKFIELYCFFNESRYLEPIPSALTWLNNSKIEYTTEEGLNKTGWSRFYELKSNIPIFGLANGGPNAKPSYAYSPSRSGYAWYGQWGDQAISQWLYLTEIAKYNITAYITWRNPIRNTISLYNEAFESSETLTESGFWIDKANRIHSKDFVENSKEIIEYLDQITSSLFT
jgi:PelA/Pel-15E family pectate lyase